MSAGRAYRAFGWTPSFQRATFGNSCIAGSSQPVAARPAGPATCTRMGKRGRRRELAKPARSVRPRPDPQPANVRAPLAPCITKAYDAKRCYVWWRGWRCMAACEDSRHKHLRTEPCTKEGFFADEETFIPPHSCDHEIGVSANFGRNLGMISVTDLASCEYLIFQYHLVLPQH